MNWINLATEEELENALKQSHEYTVALFKHSTRCAISSVAKSRLDTKLKNLSKDVKVYYLDLLAYRGLSNLIADKLNVEHKSPQLIILKGGNVVNESSHLSINIKDILKHT